jgi:hypothetical protein
MKFRKKEESRRDKNKKQQGEFLKANQQIKLDKENRKLQEKDEEKIIEKFAIKKQEMVDLRKFKEAEKFKEKQDRRQKMIDRQSEFINSVKNKEEELLSKQIQEAEEKKAKELEEKKRKMEELNVNKIFFSFFFLLKITSNFLYSVIKIFIFFNSIDKNVETYCRS